MRARGTSLAIPQSTNGGAAGWSLDEVSKVVLLEGREEHHFADRSLTGQEHREAVDPDADPTGRRHPVFERIDVVRVERWRVLVTRGGVADLLLETRALVVGVVELGERVGELHPVRERLEALDQPLVLAMPLGERRELDRVVVQQRRL